jgi:hypothetical protein
MKEELEWDKFQKYIERIERQTELTGVGIYTARIYKEDLEGEVKN